MKKITVFLLSFLPLILFGQLGYTEHQIRHMGAHRISFEGVEGFDYDSSDIVYEINRAQFKREVYFIDRVTGYCTDMIIIPHEYYYEPFNRYLDFRYRRQGVNFWSRRINGNTESVTVIKTLPDEFNQVIYLYHFVTNKYER